MQELDVICLGNQAGFSDLVESERKGFKMGFRESIATWPPLVWMGRQLDTCWRVGNFVVDAFGVLAIVYLMVMLVSPDTLLNGSLKGIESKKVVYLRAIGESCFNRLPFANSNTNCDVISTDMIGSLGGGFFPEIKTIDQGAKRLGMDAISQAKGNF
jgi:hypothetical protein